MMRVATGGRRRTSACAGSLRARQSSVSQTASASTLPPSRDHSSQRRHHRSAAAGGSGLRSFGVGAAIFSASNAASESWALGPSWDIVASSSAQISDTSASPHVLRRRWLHASVAKALLLAESRSRFATSGAASSAASVRRKVSAKLGRFGIARSPAPVVGAVSSRPAMSYRRSDGAAAASARSRRRRTRAPGRTAPAPRWARRSPATERAAGPRDVGLVAARARVAHAPLLRVAQEEARDLGLARGDQRGRVGAGVGGVEPVRREAVVDVDVYGLRHVSFYGPLMCVPSGSCAASAPTSGPQLS